MKMYTPLIKKAMDIAYKAHEGQVDKGGMPYIFHPIHVAERVDTEYEICVALLHDTIEDTYITLDTLRDYGFPERVIEAVDAMSRRKGETYRQYILRVKEDCIAAKVKAIDLKHNMDLTRLDEATAADEDRVKYYAKFLKILLKD